MEWKKCLTTTALCVTMIVCFGVIIGIVASTAVRETNRYRLDRSSSEQWRALYLKEHEKYVALEGALLQGIWLDPEIQEIERLLDERDRKAAAGDASGEDEIPERVRPDGGKIVIGANDLHAPRGVLDDLLQEEKESSR